MTKSPLARLMLEEPNIAISELKKIKIPVHILVGEHDVVKAEHTALIYDSIIDSTLELAKGESHYSYVMDNDRLYKILNKYLKENV